MTRHQSVQYPFVEYVGQLYGSWWIGGWRWNYGNHQGPWNWYFAQ